MYVISIGSYSRFNLTRRRISLIALLAAALLRPLPVFAHAKLVSSDPKADTTLASAPHRITLVFSETPEPGLSSLKLLGPAGDTMTLSPLRVDSGNASALTADVPPGLVPGAYRILWTAAGKDGHPSHGTIAFHVEMTAKREFTPVVVDNPPDTDKGPATIAVAGALGSIIARWLAFASCFVLIGVVTFRYLVLGRMTPGESQLFSVIASNNAATLGIAAAVGSLLAAMLKLVRESSDMPDASLVSILQSTWGISLLIQIAAAIVAGIALYYVHRANRGWLAALVATAALAAAPSFAAHAASAKASYIAIPTDIVHVIVGGMWLGTLTVIVIVGISAALKTPDTVRPGARVAHMINIFSPLALTCGGAVVLTGVGSALLEIPTLHSLWTTPYGVILLLKLFFVSLLFAAGAWNWKRMKPRLTGDDAIAPMRSSASLELMIAVAVLAVTSILVALELP